MRPLLHVQVTTATQPSPFSLNGWDRNGEGWSVVHLYRLREHLPLPPRRHLSSFTTTDVVAQFGNFI